MKTRRINFALALFLASALLTLAPAAPARAITLSLSTSPAGPMVGDTVTVTLSVSGLAGPADTPTTPSISGFDVFIDYDPLVLDFTSGGVGSDLDPLSFPTPFPGFLEDSVDGVVEAGFVAFSPGPLIDDRQPAGFTLATLLFTAVGPAVDSLVALACPPLPFACLSDTSDPPVDLGPAATLLSTTVTVSGAPGPGPTVPEPATLLLLGSGLAAVGLGARWRARAGHKKTA